MSAGQEVRQMIIEHWYRVLVSSSHSIDDIAKIMVEFGAEYEQFDKSISGDRLVIDEENNIISFERKEDEIGWPTFTGFGTIDASPGCKYHWTLKLMYEDIDINIGIIEAEKIKNKRKVGNISWWDHDYGYSYYRDGRTYHDQDKAVEYRIDYGVKLEKDDIVEVWLDLKEKNILSYIVNGKDFGKAFDLNEDTTYKLAVGLYEGKVGLISFETIY